MLLFVLILQTIVFATILTANITYRYFYYTILTTANTATYTTTTTTTTFGSPSNVHGRPSLLHTATSITVAVAAFCYQGSCS